MAKKLMRDVTFEEFDAWANARACDGRWSLDDAMLCTQTVGAILSIKPIFGRKKKREEAWERIKAKRFNLDAEIEL